MPEGSNSNRQPYATTVSSMHDENNQDLGQVPQTRGTVPVWGGEAPASTMPGFSDQQARTSTTAVQTVERPGDKIEDQMGANLYYTSSSQDLATNSRNEPKQYRSNNGRPARMPVEEVHASSLQGRQNINRQQTTKNSDKVFETQSSRRGNHREEESTDLASATNDVMTPHPGQGDTHSLDGIQPPSEKMRRYISATKSSSSAVSNKARSISSTYDRKPEFSAYIIKDGVGHRVPRSFNRGFGDRVVELVGPLSSQNSLYKRLAFLSDDDMAILQAILVSRGVSDQTSIQVKQLHRSPWSKKGSATLVILKDNNTKPFELDLEPMRWQPVRISNPATIRGDLDDSYSMKRDSQGPWNSPEPGFRHGNTKHQTTAISGPGGAQATTTSSSGDEISRSEVQDVSTELMCEEDYIRELTTYRVWTIQKLGSQNTSTWVRCRLEEENLSNDEATNRVIQLDKDGVSILDKKLALQPDQRHQVHRLVGRVVTQMSNAEYQLTLRQLELAKERLKGLRRISTRTSAIVVYFAKSPRPGANLHQLHHREVRELFVDHSSANLRTTPGPPGPATEDNIRKVPAAPFNPHGPPYPKTFNSQWERRFHDTKTGEHKGQQARSKDISQNSLGVDYSDSEESDTDEEDWALDESSTSYATANSGPPAPERTRGRCDTEVGRSMARRSGLPRSPSLKSVQGRYRDYEKDRSHMTVRRASYLSRGKFIYQAVFVNKMLTFIRYGATRDNQPTTI